MSSIHGRDTKPELLVRRFLHSRGLRFRLHAKTLPGCPDLVFPGRRVAVFVHGCFWHGHEGCRKARLPATREEFWRRKIGRNRDRDAEVRAALESMGWRVLEVWTCETNLNRLECLYKDIWSSPTAHIRKKI
ncbi:very short patch repair endonuclease [Azospirillum sp. B510]|uniref:very short patch repair endonuclease n=1 Tax=Azospirillum sp. (strain B510) TaxID=137722 RepID=UPI0018D3144E|nr:very short patch repair endonuclease [Azospirillum sp. B510]